MGDLSRSFMDSLVGERVGRWVVERVVRAGGMGVVTAARNPELDQEVAIKFMRPEYAGSAIASARFLREARLAARVKSPHFVRIFEYGRLELLGVPYLVMEMLNGSDLADELHTLGPHPAELAVDYVLQAAVGLAEIHALGVVHRDLKPSNLFLAEAAGTRTIKVLDFGVSKERAADGVALTSTGTAVGTPHYMSPEQVRDAKSTDVRTDVWALGVILYELLTGRLPFGQGDEGDGEVYGMILHAVPVPLRERNASLPAGVEAVIAKCLERDREKRYANVGELANALLPFAPASSLPRIEAIHRALAAAPPAISEESLEAIRIASSPRVIDPEKATPKVEVKVAPVEAPVSSAETGIPLILAPAPRRPRRPRVVAVAVVAVAVLAGGVFLSRPRGEAPRPSAAPAAATLATPTQATAAEPTPPAPTSPAAPLASATPPAPAAVAAPSPPAAPHPRASAAAPRPSPPASSKAPPDLLFDRK